MSRAYSELLRAVGSASFSHTQHARHNAATKRLERATTDSAECKIILSKHGQINEQGYLKHYSRRYDRLNR